MNCADKATVVACHLQGSAERTVTETHFQEALKLVGPSCLRSSVGKTELSPVSWEQIGGLDEVKVKLRQVNWTRPSVFLTPAFLRWSYGFLPLCLNVKEHWVADEIPRGVRPSGCVPAQRRAALRASGMCEDDAREGCSQLVPLRLPVRQRCGPLFSLCGRLWEGFSTGNDCKAPLIYNSMR